MRFSPVLSSLLLGGGSVLGATTYSPADVSNGNALKDLSKKAYDASMKQVSSNAVASRGPPPPGACTASNVKIRREWYVVPSPGGAEERRGERERERKLKTLTGLIPPTGDH